MSIFGAFYEKKAGREQLKMEPKAGKTGGCGAKLWWVSTFEL
jgi:hypothetical protein